ncbi:Aste57867_15944 [Aphanomyces stellatus]|uniref:Aste57867_15944 protein n=1 Tax=Aphanomyces stellatus TaxID=120398 RepID=A0A485L4M1_9STRA|nr:hypothetical protein As57867_015888 [Aphanomyces stellatus]VFT92730.1 Aste57867_15944 [Aphanomyces stellatus]
MAHEPERKRKRGALEDISNTHKSTAPARVSTRNNIKVALTQSQTSVSETQSTSPSQEDAPLSSKKRKLSQEPKLRRTSSQRIIVPSLEELAHAQRERQRMFDIRMNALSSEFDLDVYVEQVQMIDSLEQDTLAREVDLFHRKHEDKYRLQNDFLAAEDKDGVKSDITSKMRGILVDWLVEVGEEYKLVPHTLHMSVHLVDRCLAVMKIARAKLQLLGCACMMLACKYEEVVGPSIEDFVYISDHTYTNEEMLAMETTVVEALEYKLSGTNVYHFLERFILAGCTTETQKCFAHYLSELAVIDYHITIAYPPSVLAASVIYMTRLITEEKSPWTPTLHYYTKYNAVQVRDCVAQLYKIHNAEYQVSLNDPEKTRAVTDKYMNKKHARVGKLVPVEP